MTPQKIDYIIVGQGIAGSVLAYTLMQQQQKIIVIDENHSQTSSKIAAGLCNPIVFKRLTKSWMVEETLALAKNFYHQQEKLLGEQFYTDLPIYKLFAQEQEQLFWQQKSNEPDLFDWIDPKKSFDFDKKHIVNEFGASKTLQSGFLKTEKWLNHFRSYLKEKNVLFSEKINLNDIKTTENEVHWKHVVAKKIIFCEGHHAIHNPYFNWLPFKLTKGEVLTVKFKCLQLNSAINKGVFVLPYGENYKLGATYDWENLNEISTEKAKEELLEKAKKFISDEILIIDHKAGIRPTVSDRKPLIGQHPKFKNMLIFNGLGTKGVMLAPYFAEKLMLFLLKNESLSEEVNINRFF
ncbi:MAG: FAD-dependent oxidoreductase [Bacteroidetes bacterium HGW-Bacteroidetes-12]|jgi:glycine/D-amino acid oxidase-like deaminating enzyme|nr:MAG: FAD-dependent oxidoreductase [Bacteroidetes bacterium HGW-Bacteroidetes-12]